MRSLKKIEDPEQAMLIGIGSYSFRYAVGCSDFIPEAPMDVRGFIERAAEIGFRRVLICENLNYKDMSSEELLEVKALLAKHGLAAEVGFRDVTAENIRRHAEIAEVWGSTFLRAVCAKPSNFPDERPEVLAESVERAIRSSLPLLEEKGMSIGLENHFDLPTAYLVDIVRSVGHENLGLILDTTNAIGFVEPLDRTVRQVLPYLKSMHIKDFLVRKIEAGYMIEGKALGEGQMDFESVLRDVMDEKPGASTILELSLLRDPAMTQEELLAWEMEQVTKSANVLVDTIKKIKSKEGANV